MSKQKRKINNLLTLKIMLNYENLMNNNPTVYDEFTNSIGQKITFVE